MEEREEPTAGAPGPPPSPVSWERTTSVAVDRDAAGRLASSLKRRPGHVVVTAPFATTAARLFEIAEPMLGRARVLRLSARLLVESEVARAIAGVTARGLPPPSPAAVATVIDDARTAGQGIVLVVDDADAAQLERLRQIGEMVRRSPAMREVVRLVLIGGAPLRRLLASSEAAAFMEDVALHLDVASATVASVQAPASPAAARVRSGGASRRFVNEKLLVLAVGVVLVTGVLLFPIEPTRYPSRPEAARDETPQAVLAPPAGATTAVDEPPADGAMPATEAPRPEAPGVEAAVPAETSSPDEARRFRPPVPAGPALQVGAFRDRENAVRLAARLADEIDGVYVDELGGGDAILYRVRVEIPAVALAARRLEGRLADLGFSAVRVE